MIRKYPNHKLQTNRVTVRKSHTTISRHQEDKAKQPALSSPSRWLSECTQSNAQQNGEQLQNPTMGVKINHESTTTEPPP